MTNQKRNKEILKRLEEKYKGAEAELNYESKYELLVAVILSAQATDKQVNQITEELFAVANTPQKMAALTLGEIEELIRGVGLYRTKAKNILVMSKLLLEHHNGKVPKTIEELMALPGVGRKTANVVLSVGFNIPALAVDTHVFRVANRTGLAAALKPTETEEQLTAIIPKKKWADAHHWLIHHGRYCCKAQNPMCEQCFLNDICPQLLSERRRLK